jgi:hypothetical protein
MEIGWCEIWPVDWVWWCDSEIHCAMMMMMRGKKEEGVLIVGGFLQQSVGGVRAEICMLRGRGLGM